MRTVGQAVEEFYTGFGFDNTDADRIWFHDFCHVLTGELGSEHVITTDGKDWGEQPTHVSEILAAVYQAVLLRENQIYPSLKQLQDAGMPTIFRTIANQVVPKAMKFLGRGNVDIEAQVPQARMYEHFQLAGHLARRLEEKFGYKIGSVAREQIACMTMAELKAMIEESKGKVVEIGVFIDR